MTCSFRLWPTQHQSRTLSQRTLIASPSLGAAASLLIGCFVMNRIVARFRRRIKTCRILRKHKKHSILENGIPARFRGSDASQLSDPKSNSPSYEECHAARSRLESVPAEVRRLILSVMDLPTLKAAVRASPTLYQQYLLDRHFLLCKSIDKTLDSVAIDAYAVQVVTTQSGDRDLEYLQWLQLLAEDQFIPLLERLTLEEAVSMANFYLRLIQPIRELYTCRIREQISIHRGKTIDSPQTPVEISRTEFIRLTRAMYRFHLLVQLRDSRMEWLTGRQNSRMKLYLKLLEPWEIEELLSFYQFAQGEFDKILDDVQWDLHPDNPKFNDQHRPPTPEGAFDLSNSWYWNGYVEGLTLHGLPLLHTVLYRIKNHQHLVDVIQQHMQASYIPLNTMEGIFGETEQALERSDTEPSDKNGMQERRDPLPFRGDSEPDAPPLAWTTIWGGTYSNLYGWYIPDELREWGYVFWDATTLEAIGGIELLRHQWDDCWGGDDPRDDL
ncbi:hypothetical protein B0I35DRAFT_425739 [Stachybotrys elegans]|uniref:Uncharacterized protein n=1 Tax=Stachybotrys elegans TaxID=80388 RepID=A0A8K0T095_9HYPO|nr:hypothetical protein B0I35DRAFT_425739 [Stachybotrys elegans]